MVTISHRSAGIFGRAAGPRTARRTLLERAVAEAPSRMPPQQGWMRRWVAGDQSAAALVRRYRLLPAMEHALDRLTAELGSLRVNVSAEDDGGEPYLRMECFVDGQPSDALLQIESEVSAEADCLLRPLDRPRLSVFVRTDSPDDVVRS